MLLKLYSIYIVSVTINHLFPFNLSLKVLKECFPFHTINIYYFKATEMIIS